VIKKAPQQAFADGVYPSGLSGRSINELTFVCGFDANSLDSGAVKTLP
jgi:hypothetical protein